MDTAIKTLKRDAANPADSTHQPVEKRAKVEPGATTATSTAADDPSATNITHLNTTAPTKITPVPPPEGSSTIDQLAHWTAFFTEIAHQETVDIDTLTDLKADILSSIIQKKIQADEIQKARKHTSAEARKIEVAVMKGLHYSALNGQLTATLKDAKLFKPPSTRPKPSPQIKVLASSAPKPTAIPTPKPIPKAASNPTPKARASSASAPSATSTIRRASAMSIPGSAPASNSISATSPTPTQATTPITKPKIGVLIKVGEPSQFTTPPPGKTQTDPLNEQQPQNLQQQPQKQTQKDQGEPQEYTDESPFVPNDPRITQCWTTFRSLTPDKVNRTKALKKQILAIVRPVGRAKIREMEKELVQQGPTTTSVVRRKLSPKEEQAVFLEVRKPFGKLEEAIEKFRHQVRDKKKR